MNTPTTELEPLVVSRVIKAPPARVFAAWTTPEIAQWMCTGPRRVLSADIDLRVGGKYQVRIVTEETGEHEFTGTYREIKPPTRLVFTWSLGKCCPELEGHLSQVTVDFTEHKNGTLLKITHEGLPNAEISGKHEQGWNASLDNLEKLA